jgi:hypothetical protein
VLRVGEGGGTCKQTIKKRGKNRENRMTQENNRKGKERDGIGVWRNLKVCACLQFISPAMVRSLARKDEETKG